jgi:EAL domain-containing protein (putative c-di-GMP-specific phosphodiesterase class I)
MYNAKTGGKDRFVLFDDLAGAHPEDVANDAVSLEFQRALRQGEFELHYQPIVELRTGRVNSAEALIRWRHPERGLLLPGAFLHLLEGRPIAVLIEDWVLQESIAQHQRWLDEGLDLAVSINMSGDQLLQRDFVASLREKLAAHPRVHPSRIKLEVLETSALEDIGRVSNTIVECRKFGVAFALDDFGTGYSSLLYLKQLPAKRIKIDQGFVRDMLTDPDDLAILEGVIGMAEAFKRDTIAEGVESFAHARMLIQLGCKMAQGFGIARPMPAQDMPAWVAGWKMPADLLECVPIDRSGLQLLAAGVENRAWVANLWAFLRNAEGELPERSEKACRVARWLDDHANCSMADPGTVAAARAAHAELHSAASLVAMAGAARDPSPAALAAGARLEQLGQRLLDAISALLDSRASGMLAGGRA